MLQLVIVVLGLVFVLMIARGLWAFVAGLAKGCLLFVIVLVVLAGAASCEASLQLKLQREAGNAWLSRSSRQS